MLPAEAERPSSQNRAARRVGAAARHGTHAEPARLGRSTRRIEGQRVVVASRVLAVRSRASNNVQCIRVHVGRGGVSNFGQVRQAHPDRFFGLALSHKADGPGLGRARGAPRAELATY